MATQTSGFRSSAVRRLPHDRAEREQLLNELELLLRDDRFRRSSRYSSLLQYVVEKTLEGRATELKERTIGVEVFHRPHGYDTNEDPVVRFCAAEVRKRLAQYYKGAGGASIEIELPTGSYVPQFCFRDQVASDDHVHGEVNGDPDATESLIPRAIAPVPEPAAPKDRRLPTVWLVAIIAVVLAAGGSLVYSRTHSTDPIDQFWSPILELSTPVQIVTGVPPQGGQETGKTNDLTIKEHFDQPGNKISLATASAIAQLSGFLQSRSEPFNLSEADAMTIDNLRHKPLVLVNANNNRWTLFLSRSLRFQFQSEGDTGYIIDSQHPDRKEWKVDFTRPYQGQSEDYAVVARYFDQTTQAPIVIVAGIGSNGTQAAGDFVTSRVRLDELSKLAPARWKDRNFEAVLKVQLVGGHPGQTEIVATHFW